VQLRTDGPKRGVAQAFLPAGYGGFPAASSRSIISRASRRSTAKGEVREAYPGYKAIQSSTFERSEASISVTRIQTPDRSHKQNPLPDPTRKLPNSQTPKLFPFPLTRMI